MIRGLGVGTSSGQIKWDVEGAGRFEARMEGAVGVGTFSHPEPPVGMPHGKTPPKSH